MYAHVVTATGWTWEYIDDHVDLPRLKALSAYWRKNPPVHITAAALAGIGGGGSTPSELDENGQSLFDVAPRAP